MIICKGTAGGMQKLLYNTSLSEDYANIFILHTFYIGHSSALRRTSGTIC
jgi:hypothetical protein